MNGIDPAYSAALDEIYRLRAALAYEARTIEAHLLLATFPKSRRPHAEQQITRMRAAVVGDTGTAYQHVDTYQRQQLLRDAGGTGGLTRGQWEAEVAERAKWTESTGAAR